MLRGFVPLSLCGSGLIVFTASLCRSWFRPNKKQWQCMSSVSLADASYIKSSSIFKWQKSYKEHFNIIRPSWELIVHSHIPKAHSEPGKTPFGCWKEDKIPKISAVRDYFKLSDDKTKTVRQIRYLKVADHNNHEKRNHMNAVSSKAIVWLYQLAHLAHLCFSHFG